MTNNPAPKKRGRPRKDAQPFFTENIKIIKEAPQKALVKKVNLVDATSNKHFVHAIVNNYHEAKLLTALCQSVLPNIEIKIVKL